MSRGFCSSVKVLLKIVTYPCKRETHKMVKDTQTIPWKIADELFECV